MRNLALIALVTFLYFVASCFVPLGHDAVFYYEPTFETYSSHPFIETSPEYYAAYPPLVPGFMRWVSGWFGIYGFKVFAALLCVALPALAFERVRRNAGLVYALFSGFPALFLAYSTLAQVALLTLFLLVVSVPWWFAIVLAFPAKLVHAQAGNVFIVWLAAFVCAFLWTRFKPRAVFAAIYAPGSPYVNAVAWCAVQYAGLPLIWAAFSKTASEHRVFVFFALLCAGAACLFEPRIAWTGLPLLCVPAASALDGKLRGFWWLAGLNLILSFLVVLSVVRV